jgi:hypothetical protein
MIAAKQAKFKLVDDKSKQVYSDNTDKKRARRPLITGKADLQVAEFISILDVRFNADCKEYELCVRTRQDDEVARSWVKASALDYEDDEEEENKLLKLIDLYEHNTTQIKKSNPFLLEFYDGKIKQLAILREQIVHRKFLETIDAKQSPMTKGNQANDYLKKLLGKPELDLKAATQEYEAKTKLYRAFTLDYCQQKFMDLEKGLADEYSHIDYSKLISWVRRTFENKYRERVIQKLKTGSRS